MAPMHNFPAVFCAGQLHDLDTVLAPRSAACSLMHARVETLMIVDPYVPASRLLRLKYNVQFFFLCVGEESNSKQDIYFLLGRQGLSQFAVVYK